VHSKKWIAPNQSAKIKERKLYAGKLPGTDKVIRQVIQGHESTPRNAPPNSQIDKVDSDGKVIDRSFYDINGFKAMSIHTDNHGNAKEHPFGDHGEP